MSIIRQGPTTKGWAGHMRAELESEYRRGQPREMARILNALLADEQVLYVKTRNYCHLARSLSSDLAKLFEAQYRELNETMDQLSQRARSLGGPCVSTLTEYLKQTCLSLRPYQGPNNHRMLADLQADHEKTVRRIRGELKRCDDAHEDIGTMGFLKELMERHEMMAWTLRVFLEDRGNRRPGDGGS